MVMPSVMATCKTNVKLMSFVFCIRDNRVSLVDLKPIGKTSLASWSIYQKHKVNSDIAHVCARQIVISLAAFTFLIRSVTRIDLFGKSALGFAPSKDTRTSNTSIFIQIWLP